MDKDIHYKNVVFFVQLFQSLVNFKRAAFVKANIATSLGGSVLECYTSKLSDFNRDTLNNDLGVKSWINTLFYYFKVLISVILNFLTYKSYLLEDS